MNIEQIRAAILALVEELFNLVSSLPGRDTSAPVVNLTASVAQITAPGPVEFTVATSTNTTSLEVYRYPGAVRVASLPPTGGKFTDQITEGTGITYTYRAVARSAENQEGVDELNVAVDIPVVIPPPTLTLKSAPNPLDSPGPITLKATPDSSAGITRVVFKRVSPAPVVLGERTAAPWEWQDDTALTYADNGPRVFEATVEDRLGRSSAPAQASVTVSIAPPADTTAPTVALTAELRDRTVILKATASSPSGIKYVKFYRQNADGSLTLIRQENGAPYEAFQNVTEADNGNVTYLAIATSKASTAPTGQDSKTVAVALGSAPPVTLLRSRKRSDYTLPDAPMTITKAALLAGAWGPPNADGWYEIPDFKCHSLTPGVPCIRVKHMDTDLKVKIIRPVLDGLGVPGSNAGGLIVAESENSVWVDDYLLFSSPPPVGGNGKACLTMRSLTAESPREIRMTRGESYGTGGIYVNRIAQGGKFRNIYVGQAGGYNIRGTGYNADGTVRLTAAGRIDISAYLGYSAQFFQLNNAPDAPEGSVIVEYWVAHTDPLAMRGRNAGQREDDWNIHAAAGAIIRHYLEENGMPWDPNWDGTQPVFGVDPASPSGRGYGYSGSGGLGDGYTKSGFTGTPGPNDVTHQVYAEDGTSLNNLNVGFGVTAGNRMRGKRLVSFVAGVIRSNAPGGYSRLAVKAAPAPSGESGNNAVQAFQFYMAQGDKALFYGHEMDDLRGAYCWIDNNGNWRRNSAYISDPNGTQGTSSNRTYNSIKFRQGGVELPPFAGGIKLIETPTSVADALAKLDAERQARIDTFVAAGKVIGMSDRPLGDVTNYWAGVPA